MPFTSTGNTTHLAYTLAWVQEDVMPQNYGGTVEIVDRGGGIGVRVFDSAGSILAEFFGTREQEADLRNMANYQCSSRDPHGYGLIEQHRFTAEQWRDRQMRDVPRWKRDYVTYRAAWATAVEDGNREWDVSVYREEADRIRRRLEAVGVEFDGEGNIIEPEVLPSMGAVTTGLDSGIASGWVVRSE